MKIGLDTYSKRRDTSMPLSLADTGKTYTVKKLGGAPEMKKHLELLGFEPGSSVQVINTIDGNLIVNVKNERVAISHGMAQRIII